MIGPFYVNTEQRRIAAWGQPCQIPWATITLFGKEFKVHRDTVGAWAVFEAIRQKHRYMPTGTDTGFYSCRHMRHNPALPWSAHAWATALDLNWLQNPAGSKLVTDMPKAMITELQGVRTKSGAFVWMWGGDWDRDPRTTHTYYDAMHWETIAHPLDLQTGFDVEGYVPPEGDPMTLTFKQGDRGGIVSAIQLHLNDWKPALALVKDGIYGGTTAAAVRTYQEASGIINKDWCVPGECDPYTFAALATNAFRNPDTLKNALSRPT